MKLPSRAILGLVIPCLVFYLYVRFTSNSPSPYFPPPGRIWESFQDTWLFAHFATDVVPSLRNLVIGFSVAAVTGVTLGLVLGRVIWLQNLFMPLVHFFRSVPPIMVIPPLVLIIGTGDASKVAIIFVGSLFPILIASLDGVRSIDPVLTEVSRGLRIGRFRAVAQIYGPAAGPAVFGGLETGLQISIVLMVASEMVAATHGIGYLTMQAQATFDAAGVWSGMVLLSVIGFLIAALFKAARSRMLAWHIGMSRVARDR
ncbi:ABC transporter permease [Micromonospora inyonensis]|uniref:ABC-type nitrate/sulfonate/bicarbonate transport system, permease component n=1 Tax=Micromonospora inyonensis TaxID=47866 RepID=A0A1C6SAN7_9ACTN|nr:ABC transporter permease [Micromonospora inyonensis]SCL26540.1 ABC-type nitrate/sulfonate/bicarbonate transport system, permease component [Micromonospora inyonensis]